MSERKSVWLKWNQLKSFARFTMMTMMMIWMSMSLFTLYHRLMLRLVESKLLQPLYSHSSFLLLPLFSSTFFSFSFFFLSFLCFFPNAVLQHLLSSSVAWNLTLDANFKIHVHQITSYNHKCQHHFNTVYNFCSSFNWFNVW